MIYRTNLRDPFKELVEFSQLLLDAWWNEFRRGEISQDGAKGMEDGSERRPMPRLQVRYVCSQGI